MSSNAGVYLVSSKPVGGESQREGMDNPGFHSMDSKVTYSNANGVDIAEERRFPDKPYRGMGKEDLLHFSSKPFWKRMRLACISIIVLAWFALIITVVALVIAYPKCRDPGARSWWQNEVMYRIYVPSFKDSNGDGIGDLKGVESKLQYIQDLGANVISLSPFYSTAAAAMFDEGNDMAIKDHQAVDANFGTLEDFTNLVKSAHEKNMYVVVDFIPNLTSDEHPWFISSSNNTSPMQNFYVWTNTPTNNWVSKYGGSAWNNNAVRGMSYLHQFHASTPDLNLRSAQVQDELESILDFWLDQDVDGFNVRDAAYLYEDYDQRDEPLKSGVSAGSVNYADYDHIYTTNQPEVYGLLSRWRALLRAHNKTSTDKLMMANLDGGLDVMEAYSECDHDRVQMPLNTKYADFVMPCSGACITSYVDRWMGKVPSGKWANWVSGDDQMRRMASYFNTSLIEPFVMLTMLLPGTPVLYYGDEINMDDASASGDPWTRQQTMRLPMQWENATDGGFCNGTCTPWVTPGDPSNKNVMAGGSLTNMIKELSKLRTEPSFRVGDYATAVRDNAIFSFVREFDGETGYLVAINFGPTTVSRDFSSSHSTIQSDVIVTMSHRSDYEVDDEVSSDGLEIGPYGGVVVSWDYMAKEL